MKSTKINEKSKPTDKFFSSLNPSHPLDGTGFDLVKFQSSILESSLQKNLVDDVILQGYKFNYDDNSCFKKPSLATKLLDTNLCEIKRFNRHSSSNQSSQNSKQNQFLAQPTKLMSPVIVQEVLNCLSSNFSDRTSHAMLMQQFKKTPSSLTNYKTTWDKFYSSEVQKTSLESEVLTFEQQTDNLVEEIYLSSQASLPNLKISPDQKNLELNGSKICCSKLNDKIEKPSHFVVVAIDFGTTYSGYAFSFTSNPERVHVMQKWDEIDYELNNQKVPTVLLLKPDGTFHSFGYQAKEAYYNLLNEEAKNWLYFEKFKMTLHSSQVLSRNTEITAANGRNYSALKVFSHALIYFKERVMDQLSEQSATHILLEDIRWVVTVPAIWRQPAKHFMRAAAYDAGLASEENPQRLLIALEPEAAALYCRKIEINKSISNYESIENRSRIVNQRLQNTNGIFEQKGTRYMVVDCGGGTVDITIHEIQNEKGSIKEIKKASGGPFGSIQIDNEFEKLLNEIFGKKYMEEFKKKLPLGYFTLMSSFETRKRSVSFSSKTPFNITLPFSFIQYFKKLNGFELESLIKKHEIKGISYCPKLGMLRMQPELIKKLFHPVCQMIIDHINTMEDLTQTEYLFLVGGFAESSILRNCIQKAFSSKLKVIIPQGVSTAILRGAVLFGLNPSIISVRRSRMTYGIGILNRFIHGIHPLSKRIVCDKTEWCSDVFDKFVLADQSIASGDVVTRSYTPAVEGKGYIVMNIYCSEKEEVRFVTDEGVSRCGTLVLDLEPNMNKQMSNEDLNFKNLNENKREIQTKMIFGDTEIKIAAIDLSTGRSVRAEIDFLII